MTDLTDELRAECLLSCQLPTRPDGPTEEELVVLSKLIHWRAAAEIERLVGLGATRVPWDSYPTDPDFVVLADPEGNRFCVVDADHG